jgi:hypothetical protein
MEGRRSNPPSTTLKTAYQQVLANRKVNASMLKWSLAFAEAEKERRTAGRGVTLYLL